jgi:autotransporter-associated beta strand protein
MNTAPMQTMPAARRAGFLKNVAALLAALACLALAPRAAAQSGTITLIGSDPQSPTTSWNSGSIGAANYWSDKQAPHSDADYVVDATTGSVGRIATPQATGTFAFEGKSLTLRNDTANPGSMNPAWNPYNNSGPMVIKSMNAGGVYSKLIVNDLRLESCSNQAMIIHNQGSGTFNPVTLAGNITLATGTSRLVLNAANVALLIESNISGAGGIWFDNGSGGNTANYFTLAGNNTYTGATIITGSHTVRLESDTALGNTSGVVFGASFTDYTNGGPHTLDGGATLDLNGHNANLGALSGTWATSRITNRLVGTTGTATITVATGTTTYAGILNNAPGALAVAKTGPGTLVLTGTGNTWTGDTTIAGGLLLVQGNAGSNAASSVNIHSGGALAGTGTVAGIVRVQDGGALRGAAGSTLTIGGLVLTGTGAALDTTLGAPSAIPLFQVNGAVTLGGLVNIADATLAPGSYALANYTGALNPAAALAIGDVSGAGVDKLILAVDTATAGQINLLYADADYWIGGAGAWDAAAQNFTDYTATGSHAWRAGVLAEFRDTAATVTITGTAATAGLIFATDGWQLTAGALALANPASVIRVGDATSAAGTFTATIASALTGAGGLEKTDLGTLVLAGDNTYAGATTVREGALVLNGSHTGAGPITVKTGARLSGTGATTATATIENGGILAAAGSAPLTLGGLALSASSQLNLALGAPAADALFQVNGDLTLDGILNITDAGGFGAGLYRIFNYTGALTDNGVALGATAGVAEALLSLNTATAGQVNLIYQAANLWNTGNGAWSASGTTQWLLGEGNTTAATGFALFSGAPATITLDTAAGPIAPLGIQFATDGWLLTGGALTTAPGAETLLRVGDGTPASAAFTATIASAITGAGGLEKNDHGTLVLAGNNTYTGATVVKLGTLRVDGIHNAGAAGGDYLVTENGALAGTGRIAGAVTIDQGGILLGAAGATLATGNLILTEGAGVNIALGAPAQSAATAPDALFRVNGDLTLDGTLNITDAGGMGPGLYRIFEYTGALTDNGLEFGALPAPALGAGSLLTLDTAPAGQVNLIYGTADFWAGGSGEWTTTGSNWTDAAGTGTTTWGNSFAIFRGAPGTVTINSGASPADRVAFNGAQFAADGYILDGNLIVATIDPSIIRVGDGTVTGTAITATIKAEISGAGGLDKTDLGTLVIAGRNTYTGATRIKGGVLRLDDGYINNATILPGARLEGAGLVRGGLVNDGELAPGLLTSSTGHVAVIAIDGNYTQTASGTLTVITGTRAGDQPNTTIHGASYLLVSGAVTLDGDLVVANSPAAGVSPIPGAYYTIISANGGVNGTFANMDAPWGRLSHMVRFEVLYGANDVRLSFTQLSYADPDALPGITANQRAVGAAIDSLIGLGTGTIITRPVTNALNALQTGDEVLAALNALSPQPYERYFAQTLHSIDAGVRSIEARLAAPPAPANKWSLWTELITRGATTAGNADIRSASTRSYGAQAGLDRAIGEHLKAGLFLSLTDDDLDDRLEATRHLAGVYGRATLGRAFVDAVAGAGTENLGASRVTSMTGYRAMTSAKTDARDYFGSIRLGAALAAGRTNFTPYAALQYAHWKAGAFDERAAWGTQLRVAAMEGESLATRLGFELSRSFGQKTRYTPRLGLAWRHEFEDTPRDITASIAGRPFTVRAQKPGTDGFIAALGFDAALTARLTAYLGLAYERSTALKSALDANTGLMWKF